MRIPPTKPFFAEEDIDSILTDFREILEGKSFLSSFKHCEQFEGAFAQRHGRHFGVTCNSGTSALELCFRGLNIHDSEVIMPSVTFAATAYAALANGNRPVFAESAEDMSVDPDDVEQLITPATAAVVTVHIGGHISPRIRQLQQICESNDIVLIEDAAHAHGSALKEEKAGSFGEAAGFSFFSTKVMTTGEGGMVITDNQDLRDRAMLIRNYAKKDNRNYHTEYGTSMRMTEVQALMGLAQLSSLDAFIQWRQELAQIYDDGFADEACLEAVPRSGECRSNFYKYLSLLPPTIDRAEFTTSLKEQHGVSLGGPVYETPLHEQPVFAEFATRPLPIASDLCRRHICPPMYHSMTNEEAKYVVVSVRATIREFT